MNPNNQYTKMQKRSYLPGVYRLSVADAMEGEVPDRDHFTPLNEMEEMHRLLFKGVPLGGMALDFGCGPGRAMVKYYDMFDRIDGVDISEANIELAEKYLNWQLIPTPNLYVNNGVDLSDIPSDTYDAVYSIQVMSHIGVYDIRRNLLEEMHRVLKPGGMLCLQMGYGIIEDCTHRVCAYYDNKWDAKETNGRWGCTISDPEQPRRDLVEIGFKDFSYDLVDMDTNNWSHPKWIWFRGRKS
jgi:ubiquinone/menaquinone biosynthesis C-methylase UbiE